MPAAARKVNKKGQFVQVLAEGQHSRQQRTQQTRRDIVGIGTHCRQCCLDIVKAQYLLFVGVRSSFCKGTEHRKGTIEAGNYRDAHLSWNRGEPNRGDLMKDVLAAKFFGNQPCGNRRDIHRTVPHNVHEFTGLDPLPGNTKLARIHTFHCIQLAADCQQHCSGHGVMDFLRSTGIVAQAGGCLRRPHDRQASWWSVAGDQALVVIIHLQPISR